MIDAHYEKPKRVWPFPKWHPMLAGALVGVFIRIAFYGMPGEFFSPMVWAFISLAPLAVGAVTVYVSELTARRSWGYYLMVGMGANLMFILGTMLIMIEGLICAILIAPMFALYGALGALVMGALCRATNWPTHAVYSFTFLPFLVAALVPAAGDDHLGISERTLLIQAPPERVWQALHGADKIDAAEVEHAWLFRIGVPLPQSGLTKVKGATLESDIVMGKSIRFKQVAADWRENSYVNWQYRFAPDSFPPHALDDHVKIGGHYFDLTDTVYTLTPRGDATELKMRMRYRVSTQFNWYAVRVANILFGNLEEVTLDFYARRAERLAT